jgi:hypothetical protein
VFLCSNGVIAKRSHVVAAKCQAVNSNHEAYCVAEENDRNVVSLIVLLCNVRFIKLLLRILQDREEML